MRKILLFFMVFCSLFAVSNQISIGKYKPIKFKKANTLQNAFEFAAPTSIVFVGGNYYVLDASAGGILQFSSNFAFEKKLYGIGQGPEDISNRTAFMVVRGECSYIPDTFNGRIQIYNAKEQKYYTVKAPEMTFITNGTVIGDNIYFGGMNCIYKLSNKLKIEKIKLDLGNAHESILHLVSNVNDKLCSVSMLLHGEKQDKIYFWEQRTNNFQFTKKQLPKLEPVSLWKKKNKFPILFVSAGVVNGDIYLSTKIFEKEKGSLIYKINKEGKISHFWLNGIEFAMFSFSVEDANIYEIKSNN